MNLSKKALMAVVASLVLAPTAAMAAPAYEHAVDKNNNPILDARGNCVYTKWQAKTDTCGKHISRDARTVYFDFNKSTIKASEKGKLDALIKAIKGSKQINDVDIVGFADKIGDNGYNKRLSEKRAEAVRAYLVKKGVKIRKIDMMALGESRPVTKCDDKLPRAELIACLAADRRVEIQLNYAK